MHRGLKTLIVAGAAALVMAPMQARADGFVSPWIGSAFGGGDGASVSDELVLELSSTSVSETLVFDLA